MFKKINIITGKWTNKSFYDVVSPYLSKLDNSLLDYCKSHVLKINETPIVDDLENCIFTIDRNSWYLNDSDFFSYVKNVSSIRFKYLSVFDSPFVYEKPESVSWRDFCNKLNERSKIIVSTLKKSGCVFIAPPFSFFSGDIRDFAIEFFSLTRNLFDIWSFHCVSEISEEKIANITSLINECFSISKKPLWITKFSIPSCEHSIKNAIYDFNPNTYNQSALQMKTVFKLVESLSKSNSKWFYCGSGSDFYHPDKPVPDFWSLSDLYPIKSERWISQHFLGSMDYKNNIKKPIIDALVSLNSNA